MTKDLLLVFDCITSGLTAYLFHFTGSLIVQHHVSLSVSVDGRKAEQNPLDWWCALCHATKKVLELAPVKSVNRIAAISFSAQSQVCLCLNADGHPLYPAITWSDTRSAEVVNPVSSIPPREHYYMTGLWDEPSSSIRKLIWLREKYPALYASTHYVLQCKDYLVYRLTDNLCTDYTDASSTHALDINCMDWCEPVLQAAGVPRKIFPPIFYSNEIVGTITSKASGATGLCTDIPVVLGAGDVLCSAVGAGCTEPGQIFLGLGSSSWMAQCRNKPVYNIPNVINNPHAVPGLFLCFTPVPEAGVTFKWLKNEILCYGPEGHSPVNPFLNIYPYTNMETFIEKSIPGANGLFFLPHIMGVEVNEPHAAILGLTWRHTQADIVRAALEGICFELKKRWINFTTHSPASKLIVVGPAQKEEIWLQLLSNILNITVYNTTHTSTTDAIGAAIIAGQAIGLYQSFSQSNRFYSIKHTFHPQPEQSIFYQKKFEEYLKINF